MLRFTSYFAVAIIVFLVSFTTGTADDIQPFTPLSITENKETDTSPEEVTEIMVPICKLFFDAYRYTHLPLSWKSGAFSPDGRYFAVSSLTNSGKTSTTTLFDLKSGKNTKRFNGLSTHVTVSPVAFSSDSQRLAFLWLPRYGDMYIVVWDISEEIEVSRILLPKEHDGVHTLLDNGESIPNYRPATLYSLRFSEDGKYLWGGTANAGIIWDIDAQGKVVRTFSLDIPSEPPPSPNISAFHCYPDLSYAIFSDSNTGTNWLRNLATNEDLERTPSFCVLGTWTHLTAEYRAKMVFSDDQRLFAMEVTGWGRGGLGSRLLVWDAATGSDICTIPLDYTLTAFTFLPGGHTLMTACDPNPERPHVVPHEQYIPLATPIRRPVAKTETKAIIEFWDANDLIWHKEKVNLFPRKIKTAYLEGDDDIHYMTASQDGKLLYMRSGKNIMTGNMNLSIANGYIFSLDPNHKADLPAEIQLDDNAIVQLSSP